jgi:hypothetical protein
MQDTPHDGVRDREDRSSLPPTGCQTPIQSRYIRPFCTDCTMGELGEARSQALLPFACLACTLFSRTLIMPWGNPRPCRETCRRAQTGHSNTERGDEHFRASLLHARHGLQERNRTWEREGRGGAAGVGTSRVVGAKGAGAPAAS